MTRGSVRVLHTKDCPAKGVKPQSRLCRCSPRVRIRLAGRDFTVGQLRKGWTLEDLAPYDDKLVEMRRAIVEGRNPAPPRAVTLAEYAPEWFQALHTAARLGSISPNTFNTYEGDWRRHIKRFFGSYPMAAIDAMLINRYIDGMLAKGYSKNKTMSSLTVLSGMLTDAMNESPPLITAHPMRSPRRSRHGTRRVGVQIEFEKKAPKHLELEQALAILELVDLEYFDMVLCPLVTGFRRMEIAGLEWPEIEVGRQVIELTGQLRVARGEVSKPGAKCRSATEANPRVVPLTPSFAASLGRRRHATGYVFLDVETGKPFSGSNMTKFIDELYIQAAMKPGHEERERLKAERAKQGWAGISREHGLGWHALRHTYNSLLAQGGVPRHVREELMGHKRQDITGRYEHVMSGDFKLVREVLEQAFGDIVRRRLDVPAEAPGTPTSNGADDPVVTPAAAEPMGTHRSSSDPDFRSFRL